MGIERSHRMGLNGAVAAVLRGELAAAGLTQETISARTGIPLVSLRRYLAAERAIKMETLEAITDALGVDAQEVVVAAAARLSRGEPDPPASNPSRSVG